MALVFAPAELDCEIGTRTLRPGMRVIAVVENRPSSTAVVRHAARLAEEHNCKLTIVVTWNDRSARLLACAWLAPPVSCVDAAGWECDSASERARELRKTVGEPPGLTHYCRKGRSQAVARELARGEDGTTIVLGSPSSAIGEWSRRLWSAFRREDLVDALDRAMPRRETRRVSP